MFESDPKTLTCRKCSGLKPETEFAIESATRTGRSRWCRDCHAFARSHRLYQIDVDSLWSHQQGKCAVCFDYMLPKGRTPLSMVVDHDHKCCNKVRSCGKCVRGLLHRFCNRVVADLEDPEFFKLILQAEKYLLLEPRPNFPFLPGLPGRIKRPEGYVRAADRAEYKTNQIYRIDFNSMWDSQDGKCAVCSEAMAPTGKTPLSVNVDHDHTCCSKPGRTCGKCVRGMVHMRCNIILGKLESPTQKRLREMGFSYLILESLFLTLLCRRTDLDIWHF